VQNRGPCNNGERKKKLARKLAPLPSLTKKKRYTGDNTQTLATQTERQKNLAEGTVEVTAHFLRGRNHPARTRDQEYSHSSKKKRGKNTKEQKEEHEDRRMLSKADSEKKGSRMIGCQIALVSRQREKNGKYREGGREAGQSQGPQLTYMRKKGRGAVSKKKKKKRWKVTEIQEEKEKEKEGLHYSPAQDGADEVREKNAR